MGHIMQTPKTFWETVRRERAATLELGCLGLGGEWGRGLQESELRRAEQETAFSGKVKRQEQTDGGGG